MANPTTNYGFVLPTSSDLVTDLPADFDVALQGVDTRLKALNPSTTLGDIEYRSATANTNTRLPIGTTGQVLTVAGGVPTWSAAASGVGAWTAFTPTRSNITVGNGTEIARYQTVGKTVNVFYKLTFGSTTSFGGVINIATPTTPAQTDFLTGGVLAADTGVATYMGQVWYTLGAAYPQIMTTNATYGTAVTPSATVPFTWGTSDILTMMFSYEEA